MTVAYTTSRGVTRENSAGGSSAGWNSAGRTDSLSLWNSVGQSGRVGMRDAGERLRDGKGFGALTTSLDVVTPDGGVGLALHNGRVIEVGAPTGAADVILSRISDAGVGAETSGPPLPNVSLDAATETGRRWHVSGPQCEPNLFPPLDHLDMTWAAGLPQLPGVDVCWTALFLDTPFGELAMTYRVRDGQVVSVEPTWDDSADVWFKFRVRRSIGARAGRFTVPETLDDGGDCSGDIDALLLVAGLQETDEWIAARFINPERERVLSSFLDIHDAGVLEALHAESRT